MRIKTVKFIEKNFLTLIGGGLLIGLYYMSYYNLPRYCDDYDYILGIRELGFFESQYNWYMTWSGRYFGFFVLNTFLLIFDLFPATKIMPVVFQSVFVFSLGYFIKALFNFSSYKNSTLWAIVSGVFIIIYNSLPSLDEFFYWTASASMYIFGVSLLLLFQGQLIKIFLTPKKSKKKITWAFILLFMLSGTSELIPFINILIIGSITLIHVITYKKIESLLVIFLGTSVIFVLFSYLAPGNQVRANLGLYPNANNLMFTITQSAKLIYGSVLLWLKESPIIVLAILYIPVGFKLIKRNEKIIKWFNINPVFTILISAIILYLVAFPFYWTTGYQVHVPRGTNLILTLFIIMGLYNLQVLITYFGTKKKDANFALPKYAKYLLIVVFIFIIKDNRNVEGQSEIIRDFDVYKKYHQNTNIIIEKLKNTPSDTCYINQELAKGVEITGLKLYFKKEIVLSQ